VKKAPVRARPRTAVRSRWRGRGSQRAIWVIVAALLVLSVADLLVWRARGARFLLEPSSDQNVLLVTIDTLRADALSVDGGAAKTPNIDALAAHGARFTFAHAHAVVTLPSHVTILSGLLPYQHGVRDNSGFRVKSDTPTLATRLKAIGFATGAFVGGFPLTKRFGLTSGFDVYDDQMPEMRGALEVSMPERSADVVVNRALDWIGRQNGRFFAWVHVYDPHWPYRPPQDLATEYASRPYYGEVAFVDRALGPLFDRLRTLGRPTVVIVTGDHGESLGEHGEETHGMFAYEATLHVPLFVARVVPGGRPTRGATISSPVRHIDIVPTVLDSIGAPPDPSLPGSSLRDTIRSGGSGDRPAYFEALSYNITRAWAPLRGVIQGRDKYIDLPIPELYDLRADPKEEQNRATAHPDRVAVMLNMLRGYNMAPPERPGRESAETEAALRSLGYVSGSAPARSTYTEADDPKRLVKIEEDLHTATELAQKHRMREAMDVLRSVIERRPETADAYVTLAHLQWESGDARGAIGTLERALASGAPQHDVRVRLGLYLAESHIDPQRAIRVLEGHTGDDVEALNGLGVAYGDAGRSGDATRTFRRVLALDPTNGIAYQNIASMRLRSAMETLDPAAKTQGLHEAEQDLRQAIGADPSLAEAYTTLGVVQSMTDRKADAIESWKRAVDLDKTQYNALYDLWLELAASGRRDEATKYGQQFVSTAPPALFIKDIEEVRRYLSR
jgi:arylsulfatase A-like enzyme/Tfp pilus assembly protein PilF